MTWPPCQCGCGRPVLVDKRSGKPARYASATCRSRVYRKLGDQRVCMTCKESLSRSAFPTPQSKRCSRCRAIVVSRPCKNCGEPTGLNGRGRPRVYCPKAECRRVMSETILQHARDVQSARLAKRTWKKCASCNNRFEKTEENFGPFKRGEDGSVLKWDAYCKPCRKALNRDRHANVERIRAAANARTQRWHEREQQRRDEDAEYNEQWLEKKRETSRKYRRQCKERDAASEPEKVIYAGGTELPAIPLAFFIDGEVKRAQQLLNGHAPDMSTTLESVCMELGVPSRRLREWRRPGTRVRLDVVDRVLTNVGRLNWFDIYDEARFPVEYQAAVRVFEG